MTNPGGARDVIKLPHAAAALPRCGVPMTITPTVDSAI